MGANVAYSSHDSSFVLYDTKILKVNQFIEFGSELNTKSNKKCQQMF
jgi:hypothetical protein